MVAPVEFCDSNTELLFTSVAGYSSQLFSLGTSNINLVTIGIITSGSMSLRPLSSSSALNNATPRSFKNNGFLWLLLIMQSLYYCFIQLCGLFTLRKDSRVLIMKFWGVGDGTTVNTKYFYREIDHLSGFLKTRRGQLYLLPCRWLTGSFNFIHHFTLYLHKEAVLLRGQDLEYWSLIYKWTCIW